MILDVGRMDLVATSTSVMEISQTNESQVLKMAKEIEDHKA